jgi:hypothetical protein
MRQHDKIIMNYIYELGFTTNQRRIFNNWRLYFKVTNIAEITTLNGDKIRDEYLESERYTPVPTPSKKRWPNQNKPHVESIKIWKRGIRLIAGSNLNGTLDVSLGEWVEDPVNLIHYPEMVQKDFHHDTESTKWNIHKYGTRQE